MGMQFSDSTNKTGIVELLADLTNTATSASSSYSLAKKTRDVNNAFARFMFLALKASGKLQVDDSEQTDYPIVKLDVVSGQRDYPFAFDGNTTPNQILGIQRVELADSNGNFRVLKRFDQTDEKAALAQLAATSGVPYRYDELANGVFLDPKPNYDYTAGIWVYCGRTPVYFKTTDTTKKAGIPDMFHEYLAYRPAWQYNSSKGQPAAPGQLVFCTNMEKEITEYYAARNSQEHRVLTTRRIRHR